MHLSAGDFWEGSASGGDRVRVAMSGTEKCSNVSELGRAREKAQESRLGNQPLFLELEKNGEPWFPTTAGGRRGTPVAGGR